MGFLSGQRVLFAVNMRGLICNSKSMAMSTLPKFKALGLSSPVVRALSKSFRDMHRPTEIQALGIPAALTGKVINKMMLKCQILFVRLFASLA